MQQKRVKALIDAYGSEPSRWPVEERDQTLALCEQYPALERYRQQAATLDNLLDSADPATAVSDSVQDVEALMALLPLDAQSAPVADESLLDRLVIWLFPTSPRVWWRPAIAALVPVFVGALIGSAHWLPLSATDWSSSEQFLYASLDSEWTWEAAP